MSCLYVFCLDISPGTWVCIHAVPRPIEPYMGILRSILPYMGRFALLQWVWVQVILEVLGLGIATLIPYAVQLGGGIVNVPRAWLWPEIEKARNFKDHNVAKGTRSFRHRLGATCSSVRCVRRGSRLHWGRGQHSSEARRSSRNTKRRSIMQKGLPHKMTLSDSTTKLCDSSRY